MCLRQCGYERNPNGSGQAKKCLLLYLSPLHLILYSGYLPLYSAALVLLYESDNFLWGFGNLRNTSITD